MFRARGAGGNTPTHVVTGQPPPKHLAAVTRAVATGSAALALQPIVQAGQPDRPALYEGLICILDRSGRMIPLSGFMPYAEATALGRQIDRLSLALGLRKLAENPGLRLSINLSARSIRCPEWTGTLRQWLDADPCLAERLVLEITERSAMIMPDMVAAFMYEWQLQGVSFAIDDFGADYTSFRYLRDFCFDMIKIDGQFVRNIARHPDNQVLVQALISVSHHFDMFTIAESVETAEDAAFLTAMGIDCMQGHHFGAPELAFADRAHSPGLWCH